MRKALANTEGRVLMFRDQLHILNTEHIIGIINNSW